MSEGMLIRCKKAATPTDSQSAIASPTHVTSPRDRNSQPVTTPPHLATTGTSIIQNKEDENEHHETPDLPTQLERAKRFGHNLSQVNVANKSAQLPSPAYPIAPKMVQCRLTIGQPGDKYEQEADRVAQQVIRKMAQPINRQPVQRQQMPEEEELQMKPLANSITPVVQRQEVPEEEELQMKSLAGSSLMQCQQAPQEEEELQTKSMVQRRPAGGISATSDLESSIQQARGGGRPLADEIKQPMEQAFGADFNSVRVHTDARSDQLNKTIQARAFTTGQDIFFRQGEYSTGNDTGKELLAHELTHVVQQNGNAVQRKTDRSVNTAKQRSHSPNTEEVVVSQPSQDTSIQRLCSECEQEQQQLSIQEKVQETLQAKEIAGYAINVNSDLAALSNPVSLQTKQQVAAESLEQEALREGFENSASAKISSGESSPPATGGTEPPSGPQDQPENIENALADRETTKTETSESTQSVEIAGTEDKSPVNADEANPTADKAAEAQGEERENQPGSQAEDKAAGAGEQAPNPNGEDTGKAANPELGDKAAEEGEERENQPGSQAEDKAAGAGEQAPNPNGEDTGKAANSETVTEQEQAIAAVAEAQAQQNIVNTETTQLVSTGIDFAPVKQQTTDRNADNAEFFEQQRVEASNIANDFLATAALRVQTIAQLGPGVSARIQESAENAKASVMAAVEQQKTTVTAQIAQQRDQVQSEAQAIIAQIQAQNQAAVAATSQTTATSRQKVETEYATSVQKVDESENNQLARIEEFYTQAKEKYRAAGVKVGDEAIAFGEQKATGWEAQIKGKDDNLWDGPLTDNRLKARAKAAREVAKQYKDGLIEEANKQADAVSEGKPKDIEAIRNVANQSREQLQTLQKQSLDNLNSVEQQVLSQLAEAQTQLTQTANQTRQDTLQSLDQQETALLQLLDGYGQRQVLAIERDAQKAIASIQDGINQAAASLQSVLQDTQAQLQGMEAPNPDELSATLAEILAEFDSSVAKVQEQTEKGIVASEQGIAEGGQQAVGAISAIAQTGLEESAAVSQEAKTTLTNLNQGATDTFNQLQQAFTTTATKTTEAAVTGFGQTTQGVQTAFDKVNQNLDSNFQKSLTDLEEGLRGALRGSKEPNLESDIQKYADEAAAKEEPRGVKFFKTLAKVLLVVAVIVVAVIFAPAAIGAVGALAGALGASAAVAGGIGAVVGGAIVGAVAGAVIQMGNNLIDGKNLLDGVGKAMLAGAIGGALGGVGAGLGNVLGQAGKLGAGLTQSVSKFGIDVAFNVAGTIAGDLAIGNPITAEAILIGVAIGSAVYVSTANLGKLGKFGRGIQGMQTRNFQAGERFGATLGNGIKTGGGINTPSVGRPDVDMPGVKPPATKTPSGDRSVADTPNGTRPDTDMPGVKPPETEMPSGDRSVADTPSGTRPDTDMPGVKQPNEEVTTETNTPNQRTTHTNEREIEPSVVAKETAADGHEIKVLKDGRVVRCSDCGEIRQQYKDVLEQYPNLKQRLDDIENIKNPNEKAEAATKFEKELSQKKIEDLTNKKQQLRLDDNENIKNEELSPVSKEKNEEVVRIIRQDNDFANQVNDKGKAKSHVAEDGSLIPANPNGSATPLEHVYGSDPAKGDSPYTSFLTEKGGVAKTYGDSEIEFDLPRVRADIASGHLKNVEILTPEQIPRMIKDEIAQIATNVKKDIDIDTAIANGPQGIPEYVAALGISKGQSSKLGRRLLAYYNTTRDGEYLIKGIIPATYLKGPYSVKAEGVKQPNTEVKPSQTDTPKERSTHPNEPEIEPQVVAKQQTSDGHNIKVLKDGRIIRCSTCEEIGTKYKHLLDRKPNLKQRLNEIEKISDLQQKNKQAFELVKELDKESAIQGINPNSTSSPRPASGFEVPQHSIEAQYYRYDSKRVTAKRTEPRFDVEITTDTSGIKIIKKLEYNKNRDPFSTDTKKEVHELTQGTDYEQYSKSPKQNQPDNDFRHIKSNVHTQVELSRMYEGQPVNEVLNHLKVRKFLPNNATEQDLGKGLWRQYREEADRPHNLPPGPGEDNQRIGRISDRLRKLVEKGKEDFEKSPMIIKDPELLRYLNIKEEDGYHVKSYDELMGLFTQLIHDPPIHGAKGEYYQSLEEARSEVDFSFKTTGGKSNSDSIRNDGNKSNSQDLNVDQQQSKKRKKDNDRNDRKKRKKT